MSTKSSPKKNAANKNKKDVNKALKEAFDNPDIPKLYTNSFSLALGAGDLAILLSVADKDIGVLNLSYTTAKTLAIKIQQLISLLEEKSGQTIMTTDDINELLLGGGNQNANLQQ